MVTLIIYLSLKKKKILSGEKKIFIFENRVENKVTVANSFPFFIKTQKNIFENILKTV